jgi:predicted amidohydrolase
MLICYDVRFPELYREYTKRRVQVVFHSFYNARAKHANVHTTIMRPTLQAHAATNHLYVSGTNSSGYYQSWPSIFVLPDGTISQACRQHRRGLILNDISTKDNYYDASGEYRDRAMRGILYSE